MVIYKDHEVDIYIDKYNLVPAYDIEPCMLRFSTRDRNTARLTFTIYNDSVKCDLTDATKATISFLKPDGTRVFQTPMTIIDKPGGKVQIILAANTLAVPGEAVAQVQLEMAGGTYVDTQKIRFIVEESLSSDQAVQSTNEFPYMQRVIEAAQALEGVDLGLISQALTIANGALQRAGGLMTGDIEYSAGKGMLWKDGATTLYTWRPNAVSGNLSFTDNVGNQTLFQYTKATKQFDIVANTNVVKKAGDTLTGDLQIERGTGERAYSFNKSGVVTTKILDNDTRTALYSQDNLETVWRYEKASKLFEVPGNTNLLKKAGDTMTGDLNFDRTGTTTRKIAFRTGGVEQVNINQTGAGFYGMYDVAGAQSVWEYNQANKIFNVNAETNLLKKTGDTMTGDILFKRPLGGNVVLGFDVDDAGKRNYFYGGKGVIGAFSEETGQSIWRHYSATRMMEVGADVFNVNSPTTNLVKKAEIYSGYLPPNGNAPTMPINTDINTLVASGVYAGSQFVNAPNNSTAFWYIEVIRYSDTKYLKQIATDLSGTSNPTIYVRKMSNNAWSAWTKSANEVDVALKAGDTFTGTMNFNGVTNLRNNVEHTLTDGQKGVTVVINDSQSKWAIGPKVAGATDWSKEIAFNLTTGAVTVASLATKLDTTTSIPLTAEATEPDVNYKLVAVRKNNVVMLKGAVTLNAGATGVTVATLPPELRPLSGNLSTYQPTADGTAMAQVFINGTTGALAFSTNTKGKRMDILLTYVI